jgi:predicted nucleic acid-binding protein
MIFLSHDVFQEILISAATIQKELAKYLAAFKRYKRLEWEEISKIEKKNSS